jgi:hypothetical protein
MEWKLAKEIEILGENLPHCHWAPSGPMTKFLFVSRPFMCLEIGSPLRREEGFVFLSRRHICCTVVSHECTLTHAESRWGHLYFMDTIHALSLYYNEQFLCKIYTGHVNAGFCSRLCLNLFYSSERQLVTSAVVGLTTDNFKLLMLQGKMWIFCLMVIGAG